MNKKIIYYSSTDFPYALLAAAIRSGILPSCSLPRWEQVQNLLLSHGHDNSNPNQGEGRICDLGLNARGEKCLAVWSRGNGDLVRRTIISFLSLFNRHHYQLIEVSTPPQPWLGLGYFLTKFRSCQGLGHTIIHRCVLEVYQELIHTATIRNASASSGTDQFL